MDSRNHRSNKSKKQRPKKKHLGLKIFLILLALIFVGGGLYVYGFMSHAKESATEAFAPLKNTQDTKTATAAIKAKKPFSVLIMGVDSRDENLVGRSDTMIVATINPTTKQTTLVSIPRDTYVTGVTINKLNSAYADGSVNGSASGGAENAITAVNKLLDIKIDHYMTINWDGFEELVNAVGGVTVNSTLAFSQKATDSGPSYSFVKGENKINGAQALAFARMRHEDPQGDYGRQARQREVISAILRKMKSLNTLVSYKPILGALGNNVKTDLTWTQMQALFLNYRPALSKQVSDNLQGNGETIDGLSYQVASQAEITRVHDLLIGQLK